MRVGLIIPNLPNQIRTLQTQKYAEPNLNSRSSNMLSDGGCAPSSVKTTYCNLWASTIALLITSGAVSGTGSTFYSVVNHERLSIIAVLH